MIFDNIFYLFSFIVLISTLISIKATILPVYRIIITALFILMLPLGYQSIASLMGSPKPVSLEWYRSAKEAEVIGVRLVEGKAIYMWLLLPELQKPMNYKFPWSNDLAEQITQGIRQAKENKNKLMMKLPFETSRDKKRKNPFYAPPQPRLPLKPGIKPPQERNHPSWKI